MSHTAKFAFKLLLCGFRHSAAFTETICTCPGRTTLCVVLNVCSKVPEKLLRSLVLFFLVLCSSFSIHAAEKNHTLQILFSTSLDTIVVEVLYKYNPAVGVVQFNRTEMELETDVWSHGSVLIRDCHRPSRQEESLYENRYQQQFLLHRTKLNARDEQLMRERYLLLLKHFYIRDLVDSFWHFLVEKTRSVY